MAGRRDIGRGLPVAALRDVTRSALAALPAGHRLRDVDVDDDPPIALVRMLATIDPLVGGLIVPDITRR